MLAALDHDVGGVADRHALGGQRARAAGAAAPLELGGVALNDADLLERDAEAVVQHLGVGGLVALAVGLGADHDVDRCRRRRTRSSPPPAGRPSSIRCSTTCRCRAAAAPRAPRRGAREAVPVGLLERGVHDPGELAGVVDLAGRGLERHLRGADEVPAAELRRVERRARAPRRRSGALADRSIPAGRRRDRRRPASCWSARP